MESTDSSTPRPGRTGPPERARQSDAALAAEIEQLRELLGNAQSAQRELHRLVEQITGAPWYPALFQRLVDTPQGLRALVWLGGQPRLVNVHPDVEATMLGSGRSVYLDHERATLMAPAQESAAPPSDSASFERLTEDGRIVARARDEEIVLERAATLDRDALRTGRRVLFDRASRLALETLDGGDVDRYRFETLENLSRDDVGGQVETLDDLIAVLSAKLIEPELASDYRLNGRRGVLMYGPPGCGKTLMARTAAAEIQRRTGRRCHFAVVRPGEFESPYVGESEANIRACFEGLREAAGDDVAVLFLDEIESIGRIRGAQGARHSDRFLAALLAEIDGFCARGPVSILAATNRRDLLDPALLSRLADTQIAVPRPDLPSARAIFAIHLPSDLLYAAPSGEARRADADEKAAAIRSELLETVVSLLYAPNAANEVVRLTFRDGRERRVRARELMSGRLIEQLARSIREKAFRRHVAGKGGGLRIVDAVAAAEDTLVDLSTTLSRQNARAYLEDLPQDVDVVRAEPIRPLPARRHQYHDAH